MGSLGATPPAAVTPCSDFSTWATYPENEISRTIPSTTHSDDTSLFDTSFEAFPISFQTSTVGSAFVLCHSTSAKSSCLAASVLAVENLKAKCISNNRSQLDTISASHKEAIKRCRLMVKCTSCIDKRENLVALVFMTEKIIAACGSIVTLFRGLDLNNTLLSLEASPFTLLNFLSNGILLQG